MRCYDCGHRAHSGADCIECECPTWRDPWDESLRRRPSDAARRERIFDDPHAEEVP